MDSSMSLGSPLVIACSVLSSIDPGIVDGIWLL